jgi:hypothetical protein
MTGDKRLQPGGEDFGQAFYGGVLKGDRPKITSLPGFILFWQKDKVGPIDALKVSIAGVEIVKEIKKERRGDGPGGFKEGRAEAIWARTSIVVHAVDGVFYLGEIKRSTQLIKLKWAFRVQISKVEGSVGVPDTAHEISIERMKNAGFLLVTVEILPVVFNHLDPVTAPSLRGNRVEVAGVLVPFDRSPDFCSAVSGWTAWPL